MNLYPHQQRFLDKNPDKALLAWEGGTGKTIGGAIWLRAGRDADALVVAPKRVVKKWQAELTKWGTKATVVTTDGFKKLPIKPWSAMVVDEADEFASPLFIKGRSKRAECLYKYVQAYPDMPILLASATPIRSSPWNLHTLLCYIGQYRDWKKWREFFYSLERRPYLPRPAWLVKDDWRHKIRPILEKYADIVLLRDCVGYLPPFTEEVIMIKTSPFNPIGVEPTKLVSAEHRHEQQNKLGDILAIGRGFRKVLVVAHFVEQVESLAKELSKDRETFMVHGGVKDQEALLKRANEVDDCFLVVQASLGAGFDADTFSCVVFASMSYKVRDFVQMKFRVRRIHNLHPVKYVFLHGGRRDKQVYKTIQLGKDFVPSEWIKK
ncbi:MAG TPA: helicase-related protein [Stenomitos sp.]